MIAVIDSSPLINLVHLDLAERLQFYFDAVLVPRMVQREVNRKSKFRHRLNKLYSKGVFTRCLTVDNVSVQMMLDELDEGEAEALVQASERGATIFIGDDKRARILSERRGLRPVGTARLLARMHLEGHADEIGSLVRKLQRDLDCRISQEIVLHATQIAPRPF